MHGGISPATYCYLFPTIFPQQAKVAKHELTTTFGRPGVVLVGGTGMLPP